MYFVIEEPSEAVMCITDTFEEAKQDAESRSGKHIVVNEENDVLFDTQPDVTYKI